MKLRLFFSAVAVAGVIGVQVPASGPAEAACRTFEASHNGTDMFHPSGAKGAAVNKLMIKVDAWQKANGIKKVRMSKVRTKCGDWFMKYMLPHKHCVARARACG